MQKIASQLEQIINRHIETLKAIPEDKMAVKPLPDKWSKKEIIGHLCDSAQSNIRRFVVAQYEDSPAIVYNQDKWVSIVNYQHWNTESIINLWYLLNKQVCEILRNTNEIAAQRNCMTQQLHSIQWLAEDYVKHLLHHLHHVLELEPVAYP